MTRTRSHGRLVTLALAGIASILATGCATAVPAAGTTSQAPQAAASATAAGPVNINGTYRFTLTQEDAERAEDPQANFEGNYPLTETIMLKDGELEGGCFGNDGATYGIDGDRITIDSREYDPNVTVSFTVDAQGSLHLTPVPPMEPGVAFLCFSKPWTRIE
jgi:hypothetical protein